MKIRTQITLLFTLITVSILLLFAAIIYFSAKENREQEFYTVLKKEAETKANLFFKAQVDSRTLQNIYKNNRITINEVEVAIYNTSFQLLYHDAVSIDFVKETKEMINTIEKKGETQFYQKDWQVVGLRYSFEGKNYIVTAAAYDEYGYSKLNNLLKNSLLVLFLSILFIFMAGWIFSKKVFKPVKEMTDKVNNISATNLYSRLNTKNNKDEISELGNTFNGMLDRLENSFDAQKNFVSNISHELRTPLSAIISELELAIDKEQDNEAYKKAIKSSLNDAKKIVRLSNSLLDLAKASYDPSEIAFKVIRIDEVLLDAKHQVQQANTDYKIDLHFEHDIDNENQISINGNEYLLKVAFANLFENGCKFSRDKECIAYISFDNNEVLLQFKDKGIGISANDLHNIFTPFYRGENKQFTDGNGIGLSLTKKIVLLHKGKITVVSKPNTGTTFSVELPNLL
ncbi:HAMP domain-containing sensor histidine kinase [Chryseobacterium lathyri]|uniref:HAMP domain-containing sensor histidine kinase n=1 Tax=Chryseobacterium lathyri TaxID=395933 RepID=UPI00278269AD|nr:HAMP domain-containing sensor histidine kinase [Chryseobacterium lathyri]MDQ0065255.1 signal transduction histidine kinase [Chryseobacterium lathyri]